LSTSNNVAVSMVSASSLIKDQNHTSSSSLFIKCICYDSIIEGKKHDLIL
jgi:hypothetical protein